MADSSPRKRSLAKSPRNTGSPPVDHGEVGRRLRDARKARGWTLRDLSEQSGIAVSTISKAERGDIALTYDKFGALGRALGLDYASIFRAGHVMPDTATAPSFTAAGTQPNYETPNYRYGMIASDLPHKRMVPMRAHIRARRLEDFPDYIRHGGEEFVFVLSGRLRLQFETGERFDLSPGDSLYFDSGVGHVYLSRDERGVDAIVCCVDTASPRGSGPGDL
ncbi:transcriptional regulator [Pandoraea morbifera]|uniref:Transcriptional regulator n=1 Tax=Pandoraea morbifera TaxID=2508300 RepID=A0A5E4RN94_9BURK|nr:XRE family transcriptional regulator [Pandoraea morbifera]VVD64261.1 transcriptional regulator [Pandoraea morbifera]